MTSTKTSNAKWHTPMHRMPKQTRISDSEKETENIQNQINQTDKIAQAHKTEM